MFSRIKAAQKYELYDASQGVSNLSRVTVEDVRNIWIHRLISEVSVFIIIHPYHYFDYIIYIICMVECPRCLIPRCVKKADRY